MEQKTIYSAYTRQVAFEGTHEECWNWLMSQADSWDGRSFYREWTMDGNRYIDVGNVYIYND